MCSNFANSSKIVWFNILPEGEVSNTWLFAFLYFFGYIFMFAYAFKYLDIVPFKVMLWSSTPYIRSGFNTTILLLFNNLINKVALYSTFATFISIACKHDRKYKKMII